MLPGGRIARRRRPRPRLGRGAGDHLELWFMYRCAPGTVVELSEQRWSVKRRGPAGEERTDGWIADLEVYTVHYTIYSAIYNLEVKPLTFINPIYDQNIHKSYT